MYRRRARSLGDTLALGKLSDSKLACASARALAACASSCPPAP